MLLLPFSRPCGKSHKISLGVCGRFTSAELLSVSISIMVVFIWIMTGEKKTSFSLYAAVALAVATLAAEMPRSGRRGNFHHDGAVMLLCAN